MSDREPEAVTNVVMNIDDDNKGQISQGDRNKLDQHVEQRVEPAIDLTDDAAARVAEVQASRILISHAHADVALADPLVDLLRLGVEADKSDIFCSSIPGQGIQAGERWLDVLANELNGTALVVILITPAYLASTFCMCELGASWIKEIPSVPLVVPPIEIGQLSGILEQTELLSIEDPAAIDELGKQAATAVHTSIDPVEWTRRRDAFLAALPEVVAP